MKRIVIAFLLVLGFVAVAVAGDNLWSLDQKQKDVSFQNAIRFEPVVVTGNGTVVDETFIQIDLATNATAVVNLTPRVGQLFFISQTGNETAATSIKLPTGVTWNGSNRSATFDAAAETLVGFCPSATRCVVVENIGTVGFAD